MKLVLRAALYHLTLVILFAVIYRQIKDEFEGANEHVKVTSFIDCLLLSTTIQSGVGVSNIYPRTSLSKILIVVQEMLLMFGHVMTLYFFTL